MNYYPPLSGTPSSAKSLTPAKALAAASALTLAVSGFIAGNATSAQAVALKLGKLDAGIASNPAGSSYATLQGIPLTTAFQTPNQVRSQSYATTPSRSSVQPSPLQLATVASSAETASVAINSSQVIEGSVVAEGDSSSDINASDEGNTQATPTVRAALPRSESLGDLGTRPLDSATLGEIGLTPPLQISAPAASEVPEPLTAVTVIVGGAAVLRLRKKLSGCSAEPKK